MTLDEKLKEIEDTYRSGTGVAFLVHSVPHLLAALKRCMEQRNNWAFECVQLDAGVLAEEKAECHCQHIKEDDAELLEIMSLDGSKDGK